MKIIAGFSKVYEVKNLIKFGASEVFCGLAIGHEVCLPSHRPGTLRYNIRNLRELSDAIKITHSLGKRIHVLVNEIGHLPDQLTHIINVLRFIANLGIDGFVVADISLIATLKRMRLKPQIVLSSVNPCFNTRALDFYRELGISRVIVPQHLCPREASMVLKGSCIQAEVFFYNVSSCLNIDGLCFFHEPDLYDIEKTFTYPCSYPFTIQHIKSAGAVKKSAEDKLSYPCFNGFSAFYDFHKIGIDYIKVGTRGYPSLVTYKIVEALSELLRILDNKRVTKGLFLKKAGRIWKEPSLLMASMW